MQKDSYTKGCLVYESHSLPKSQTTERQDVDFSHKMWNYSLIEYSNCTENNTIF